LVLVPPSVGQTSAEEHDIQQSTFIPEAIEPQTGNINSSITTNSVVQLCKNHVIIYLVTTSNDVINFEVVTESSLVALQSEMRGKTHGEDSL